MTGDDFFLEDFEIYDEFNKDNRISVIHYDLNLIVSQTKTNPYEDFNQIKKIGEGTFGTVELVEHKITGMQRAMKIIKKTNIVNPEKNNEESVLNEFNILKKIDHPNVVKIYEFYSDAENYYLITEYCPGGDLYDATQKEHLSEVQVACIMYQILLALNHIHKMKIMHRDLKLENILIYKKEKDGLYRIKLCDFGTSHLFKDGEKEKNIIGSSYYIAPEVFNQNYNFKCDLWSSGIIMYVLITKKIPFVGQNKKQIRNSILKKNYISEPLKMYSKYVQDLVNDLLQKNYEKRINAEIALTYELFKIYKCKEVINELTKNKIINYINNIRKYKKRHAFQETLISYLIHNSDMDEIIGAYKLFNKFDKNQKGKISQMEFLNALCDITKENFNKEEVREMFLNIDTNKNNYIEPEEFVKAAVDKKIFLSEKMIKFAFDFFDKEKRGFITVEDLTSIFKSNINTDSHASEEFQKIIKSADKDEDGKIGYDEFCIFVETLLEQL